MSSWECMSHLWWPDMASAFQSWIWISNTMSGVKWKASVPQWHLLETSIVSRKTPIWDAQSRLLTSWAFHELWNTILYIYSYKYKSLQDMTLVSFCRSRPTWNNLIGYWKRRAGATVGNLLCRPTSSKNLIVGPPLTKWLTNSMFMQLFPCV